MLEKNIKDLFASLDKPFINGQTPETYSQGILPQLKHTSPVVINGNPVGGKLPFQKYWIKFPLTQHSITSLDYHIIPGTGTLLTNLSGKVRFDESGRTRLGETADIDMQRSSSSIFNDKVRPLWGSWMGFNANLILEEAVLQNINDEVVCSMNWKIIYKPDDSSITI